MNKNKIGQAGDSADSGRTIPVSVRKRREKVSMSAFPIAVFKEHIKSGCEEGYD
jgi:hypothetical protein